MSLLNSEHTIQVSAAMVEAVASVRAWIDSRSSACLVVGSTGAGKSHLLLSAARDMTDPLVMPPPDVSDCSQFLEALRTSSGRLVVADDLDKCPKGLREEVVKLAGASGHALLASMTELPSRTRPLLVANFENARVVSMTDSASRSEDVEAFIARWIQFNGLTAVGSAVRDCTAFCCASGLPQGFRTVEKFLAEMAASAWDFSGTLPAADAASAYRQAISPPPRLPTILVEGYTDRVYFEWLLQGVRPARVVEVRDCGAARKVAEQMITLRNQGQSCVAVLDSDEIGKRLRKQLVEFGHPVVAVPVEAVNLPNSAYDHVRDVAEIEDLLPIPIIERFLDSEQRRPELEIRAPTGVRYVIGKSDKRELAHWVVEEVEQQEVPKLAAFVNEAVARLGAGP